MNTQPHHRVLAIAVAISFGLAATQAHGVTLTFDDLAPGTVMSNQYAAYGAVFTPNAYSGAGGPTGDWAGNTDLSVVSVSDSDVGDLGTPALVSGHLLRSFNGWLNEDGDPSFRIDFSTPVSSVSAVFAGVGTPADVRIFAYHGGALTASVAGSSGAGQFVLGLGGAAITSVVITPGSYDDWVGVDNISYAPVPEPSDWALLLAGGGLLAFRRRQLAPSRMRESGACRAP
jgi:hypothetical protein